MPLDDLVSVIETIQQRIREHGDSLRQNETRTRMALIDPLLTALGWDVADPGVVTPEYDVSGRRADYGCVAQWRKYTRRNSRGQKAGRAVGLSPAANA